MNNTMTPCDLRPAAGLPEFLDALDRTYQFFGLSAEAAHAATFADAETFAPEPLTPEFNR
jgi:hypothetical protein